jgi:hypothetical protein
VIIKIILISGILAVTVFLVRSGSDTRHLALRRLSSLVFAFCGVLAILAPDSITHIANALGVGRGADLVFYLAVVGFLFALVAQQQRTRELEDRLALTVRQLALLSAELDDRPRITTGSRTKIDD